MIQLFVSSFVIYHIFIHLLKIHSPGEIYNPVQINKCYLNCSETEDYDDDEEEEEEVGELSAAQLLMQHMGGGESYPDEEEYY